MFWASHTFIFTWPVSAIGYWWACLSHVNWVHQIYAGAQNYMPLPTTTFDTFITISWCQCIWSPEAKLQEASSRKNSFFNLQCWKADFISLIQKARQYGITSRNIESAGRATGLIPYNPAMVFQKLSVHEDDKLASNKDNTGAGLKYAYTSPILFGSNTTNTWECRAGYGNWGASIVILTPNIRYA